MTGWTLFAIAALAFGIASLARELRRLHYRLARVEYVQLRRLKGADRHSLNDIEAAIAGAVYDNRGGVADAIRKANLN